MLTLFITLNIKKKTDVPYDRLNIEKSQVQMNWIGIRFWKTTHLLLL